VRGLAQQNVELSHRAAEAFNRRDIDAFLDLQHPDVEGFPLASDMHGGYRGHGGTRRWWNELFEAFPDVTIEIVELRAHEDLTIAAVRMRGHGAVGATPVDMTLWRVDRWLDQKCVWWGSFRTESDALQAFGLRE
jgi:ketosteroid isomerase-like protein